MNTILVIEDDLGIQEYIVDLLKEHDFKVTAFSDGLEGLQFLKKNPVHLVILDLGLPKVRGEAICLDIRKLYPALPVIILTAKDTPDDIVHGLSLGADDYITKPFVAEVLLARVKARLRNDEAEILQLDDLQLDNQKIEVTRGSRKITLTPHEFKLLHYLLSNKGRVLDREMILNKVWQYSYDVDTRVVDVYIGYLRKKVDGSFKKKLIHSVRGFGYVMKAP